MKRIVSVSIGSSLRDKSVQADILGEEYLIERIGTDGDINKAIDMIRELDGKVDAFGMGGIDLYLTCGSRKKYIIREAIPIMQTAKKTPIVDGTGMKNTLERRVIEYLNDNKIIDLKKKRVLLTCAADRYEMARTFAECGSDVALGDLVFALGIPVLIRNMDNFKRIVDFAFPFVSRLPFSVLYPTGEKQKNINHNKFVKYYRDADIIAGDYHYIKKYMPLDLKGKIIVTNTVTTQDVEMMRSRGVSVLVTTTPDWNGRSFGTNVMEALLVSVSGKRPEDLTESDYYRILDDLKFKPRIEYLNES